MRLNAALTMMVCAIFCQQAEADDAPAPSQAPAPVTAAAQASSPAQASAAPQVTAAAPAPSATASAVASQAGTAPAASAVINPGVTVVGNKAELTPDEKELVNRGYKLEIRDGQKYFCRKEQQLGSRFERKYCDTAQSLLAHRTDSQEAVRTIQNDRSLVNH